MPATPPPVTGSLSATGQVTATKEREQNLTNICWSGTYGTMTFKPEGTIDGTNWFPLAYTPMDTGVFTAGGTIAPSDNATGALQVNSAGCSQVRANVTALASGTPTFTLVSSTVPGPLNASPVVPTSGSLLSTSPTAGVGYATGAGGTVTQTGSRTTAVTLNKVSGNIVLVSAAGSATPFSFTLTNSAIAAGDTVSISQKSGTDKYTTQVVTAVAAGSCQITLANASGTTTEQPVFNFNVIKGVAA